MVLGGSFETNVNIYQTIRRYIQEEVILIRVHFTSSNSSYSTIYIYVMVNVNKPVIIRNYHNQMVNAINLVIIITFTDNYEQLPVTAINCIK
jgi:hypothetical protein